MAHQAGTFPSLALACDAAGDRRVIVAVPDESDRAALRRADRADAAKAIGLPVNWMGDGSVEPVTLSTADRAALEAATDGHVTTGDEHRDDLIARELVARDGVSLTALGSVVAAAVRAGHATERLLVCATRRVTDSSRYHHRHADDAGVYPCPCGGRAYLGDQETPPPDANPDATMAAWHQLHGAAIAALAAAHDLTQRVDGWLSSTDLPDGPLRSAADHLIASTSLRGAARDIAAARRRLQYAAASHQPEPAVPIGQAS